LPKDVVSLMLYILIWIADSLKNKLKKSLTQMWLGALLSLYGWNVSGIFLNHQKGDHDIPDRLLPQVLR